MREKQIDPTENIASSKVPVFSFDTIVDMFSISSCDYLKIDTEGHDITILRSYLSVLESNKTKPAKMICFESNTLADSEQVTRIIQDFGRIGY
jgi:FkbM family methyltransferase